MAKLILSMDSLVLKEIPLDKERITIGRKPHNDIQIDNLAISGDHAVVTTILNDSFLEDMDSTNGTMVNGKPVRRHALQANDVIEMGKYSLKYIVAPVAVAAIEPDPEQVVVVWPGATASNSQPFKFSGDTYLGYDISNTGVMPSGGGTEDFPLAAIRLLDGPSAGKGMDLAKAKSTLGRAGVQVVAILRQPQGYVLQHVDGPSLPVVNNQRISSMTHPLMDKDVLEVAGTRMEFYLKS